MATSPKKSRSRKTTTSAKKTVSKPRRPARIGGLGRGLDALIGSPSAVLASSPETAVAAVEPLTSASVPAQASEDASLRKVFEIPVAQINPSPWQPRRVFDEEALEELASSIRTHGVIQPLICRRTGVESYELIAGERRLRAASEAGLREVPVVLLEAEDRDAAEMALVENLQREDLNIIEEAEGYQALSDAFGLTQQEISERVGKGRATVANALRLLGLSDEIKHMLGAGLLSPGHAKVLLGVEDELERLRLARSAAQDGWTVRQLEQRIRRQAAKAVRQSVPELPGEHLALLLERMHSRFGTSVRLFPTVRYANGRRSKGRVEIDFFDNEDLDRLLGLLGIVLDDDLV